MRERERRWRRAVAEMTREEFSQLVIQYERLVYTVCFQLVRDAGTAEDLTQETFLSAYLHRESLPAGYERQWLGRIAQDQMAWFHRANDAVTEWASGWPQALEETFGRLDGFFDSFGAWGAGIQGGMNP